MFGNKNKYKTNSGTYDQKPLTAGAFENALKILNDVKAEDLIKAMTGYAAIIEAGKGGTVTLDVGVYIDAITETLSLVGETHALTNLIAAVLEISEEEARTMPMADARAVVIDFFTINAEWLPITPAFLSVVSGRKPAKR